MSVCGGKEVVVKDVIVEMVSSWHCLWGRWWDSLRDMCVQRRRCACVLCVPQGRWFSGAACMVCVCRDVAQCTWLLDWTASNNGEKLGRASQ